MFGLHCGSVQATFLDGDRVCCCDIPVQAVSKTPDGIVWLTPGGKQVGLPWNAITGLEGAGMSVRFQLPRLRKSTLRVVV